MPGLRCGGGNWPSGNLALVGLLIAAAALLRTESRGAHFRRDNPCTAPG